MVDFKDNIGRYIALSGRHLAKQVAKELVPLGIGAGQYPYLFALFVEDGQSQQSLAKRLSVDKAAAARSVGKLVKSGYLRREQDKNDTRSFRVSLTPKARRARVRLEKIVEHVLSKLEKGLSADEQTQAKKIMRKITENLLRLD
jgi:DNA-binding MarR family transcriptional regulator